MPMAIGEYDVSFAAGRVDSGFSPMTYDCGCPHFSWDKSYYTGKRKHTDHGCFALEGARGSIHPWTDCRETGVNIDSLSPLPEGNCDKYKCKKAAEHAIKPFFCFLVRAIVLFDLFAC